MARWHRCDELVAAAVGAVLLVVVAVLSAWAHHSLSTAQSASPPAAAAQPTSSLSAPSLPMRKWLTEAEPSINALVIAGDDVVAAATQADIAGTTAACQTTAGAVANLQHHIPSPDPALNTALQQAINSYQVGIRHCISGTQNQDAIDIGEAVGYIHQGKIDLQTVVDNLKRDLAIAC